MYISYLFGWLFSQFPDGHNSFPHNHIKCQKICILFCMSLLRSRKHLRHSPAEILTSHHLMAKNEVTCLPHQITSKKMPYNQPKLTTIHFLQLVEAPRFTRHTASPSFSKISDLLAGGWGCGCWVGSPWCLNTPALVHGAQELTEASLGASHNRR